jgi:hypothetical protein
MQEALRLQLAAQQAWLQLQSAGRVVQARLQAGRQQDMQPCLRQQQLATQLVWAPPHLACMAGVCVAKQQRSQAGLQLPY